LGVPFIDVLDKQMHLEILHKLRFIEGL